jgi:hypothetical protein
VKTPHHNNTELVVIVKAMMLQLVFVVSTYGKSATWGWEWTERLTSVDEIRQQYPSNLGTGDEYMF